METQSLPDADISMNSTTILVPDMETSITGVNKADENENSNTNVNNSNSNSNNPNNTSEMTSKTVQEISNRIEEVFNKLQRNLEHNTRVFQEKSQGLLSRIDQAEEQLRKVLSQLEAKSCTEVEMGNGAPTESIALSEETKLTGADETVEY